MRFVIGPPPDTPDFTPESSGWQRIRVPSPGRLMVLGTLLGFPLGALIAFAWSLLPQEAAPLKLDVGFSEQGGIVVVLFVFFVVAAIFLGLLIVVHELLHLVAAPGCGFSRASIFGVWPSKLMPYADYQGPMHCWRACLVAMMPFTVLSLTPWVVSLLVGAKSALWVIVSVVNALSCGGDMILCGVLVAQVPLGAMVQNQGWDTWWRPA